MEKKGYSENILSEIELVNIFSNKTDAEIVAMYLDNQELSGLYYLLMVRYLRSLYKVFGLYEKNYDTKKLYDSVYDFFEYMSAPTKKENKNRLSGYDPNEPFGTWIQTCCRNYIHNLQRIEVDHKYVPLEKINFKHPVTEDNQSESDDDLFNGDCLGTNEDENGDIALSNRQKQEDEMDMLLIQALELVKDLSPQTQYIILTYLYCERYKKVGVPLYLSRQIGEVLNMSENAVTTTHSRSLRKIREVIYKKGNKSM